MAKWAHKHWVEGKTEEACFPLIIEKAMRLQLNGTEIIGLVNVGDIEGRHKHVLLQIYRKLSTGRGLLPPALAFCLDQDGRSPQQQKEISEASSGLARFIPRRMYENYLLNPAAIAAILNEADRARTPLLTPKDVEASITRLQQLPKYAKPRPPAKWDNTVHAADLLRDIFNDLTAARVAYDKLRHGVKITEWLLQNSPSDLSELVSFLTPALQGQ